MPAKMITPHHLEGKGQGGLHRENTDLIHHERATSRIKARSHISSSVESLTHQRVDGTRSRPTMLCAIAHLRLQPAVQHLGWLQGPSAYRRSRPFSIRKQIRVCNEFDCFSYFARRVVLLPDEPQKVNPSLRFLRTVNVGARAENARDQITLPTHPVTQRNRPTTQRNMNQIEIIAIRV
jgi:hypothetical protein